MYFQQGRHSTTETALLYAKDVRYRQLSNSFDRSTGMSATTRLYCIASYRLFIINLMRGFTRLYILGPVFVWSPNECATVGMLHLMLPLALTLSTMFTVIVMCQRMQVRHVSAHACTSCVSAYRYVMCRRMQVRHVSAHASTSRVSACRYVMCRRMQVRHVSAHACTSCIGACRYVTCQRMQVRVSAHASTSRVSVCRYVCVSACRHVCQLMQVRVSAHAGTSCVSECK